ncbi:MAG: hypothetical protein ACI8TP_005058 [Acidimicrobiales bacterium]|jgi:uncharacterized protein (TIGR03083 family)
MSENSRAFTQSLYGFDAVVRRINSEQWANQSPCEKWDARAVVDHVVFACVMIGGLAEGRNAAVPRTDEDGLLPAMIEDHSIAPWISADARAVDRSGDPKVWWSEQFAILLDRLDTPDALHSPAKSMWGHTDLDGFLEFGLHDPLCHTWDLATAVGQEPHLDEALCELALENIKHEADRMHRKWVLGPALETHPSAAPSARLLRFCGRDAA